MMTLFGGRDKGKCRCACYRWMWYTHLALAVCACSSEPIGIEIDPNGPILITATVEGLDTRAEINEISGSGKFVAGDKIGLLVKTSASTTYDVRDSAYVLGADNYWKPERADILPLTWNKLDIRQPVSFGGYSPKQTVLAGNEEKHPFTVSAAQNILSNYQASDLLCAATKAQGEVVQLVFRHAMARLVINLKCENGVDIKKMTKAVVGLFPTAPVNLLLGTVGASTGLATSITPLKLTKPLLADYDSTYVAVVPPQALTKGGGLMRFKETLVGDNSRDHLALVPDSIINDKGVLVNFEKMESGRQYTLNITITPGETVVTSSGEILLWENAIDRVELSK